MIHPTDEEGLRRILRVSDIPEGVADAYMRWRDAYHRAGHSGPLGTIALLCMVENAGYAIPRSPERVMSTDWRLFPQDGSQKVQIINGSGPPRYGSFLGFVSNGTLAVRLYGQQKIDEFLPGELKPVPQEEWEKIEPTLEQVLAQQAAPSGREQDAKKSHDVWWTTGEQVYIHLDDEVLEGVVCHPSVEGHDPGDGYCWVMLKGRKRPKLFPAAKVISIEANRAQEKQDKAE